VIPKRFTGINAILMVTEQGGGATVEGGRLAGLRPMSNVLGDGIKREAATSERDECKNTLSSFLVRNSYMNHEKKNEQKLRDELLIKSIVARITRAQTTKKSFDSRRNKIGLRGMEGIDAKVRPE